MAPSCSSSLRYHLYDRVFAYFRRDDDNVPWKAMKKLYELKYACNFYNRRTDWDLHAEHCIRCQKLKADWTLVGPSSSTLITYCDVKDEDVPPNYEKDYFLAVVRSKVIGGVLFVGMLFFAGVLVILCGEIESRFEKGRRVSKWFPEELTISKSMFPFCRAVHPGHWNLQVTKATEILARLPQMQVKTVEAGSQSTPQQQMVGGNKSIHINLSDEFAAALKGSFQDSAWQGIDIRCSQQEERSNPHAQGSYMPRVPASNCRVITSADSG
ncbi:hypothetical protein OS493_029955 [Desmophyllum pertusum]|uniref:Uncharacterized protein n=1 Tax=Desmophyllum pertusum TaxID=174260 RepID=A0A9W9ZXC7_9CNID|nr:hypothetical protein OS493_029955 [Desmophyllum pertusum]